MLENSMRSIPEGIESGKTWIQNCEKVWVEASQKELKGHFYLFFILFFEEASQKELKGKL